VLAILPRQASAPQLFCPKGSQDAKLEHAEVTWTLDPVDHGHVTSSSNQGGYSGLGVAKFRVYVAWQLGLMAPLLLLVAAFSWPSGWCVRVCEQ
jgi:hypothetical protein